MKGVQVRPYPSPRLPEYRASGFKAASRSIRPIIAALMAGSGGAFVNRQGKIWMLHNAPPRAGARRWQPKVYLCVRARDYWVTVSRLILALGGSSVRWKFFFHPSRGYDRPDKIVFYPGTQRDLLRLIGQLRSIVGDCRFHDLRHAASTSDLGLEPLGLKGLFVGADPIMLRQSWRLYRTFTMAWLTLNRKFVANLPGGIDEWMQSMNLCLRHEGPLSLHPTASQTRGIAEYWPLICGPAYRPRETGE